MSKLLLQPDVLGVGRDYMGVLAPNETENNKIGSETRADNIKAMSIIDKTQESLPMNSDGMN